MTKNKLFLIKIIPFLIILALGLNWLTTVLVLKSYPEGTIHTNANSLYSNSIITEKQDGFYLLENNTLDAIYIGSSAVHCNINPNVIWNEYGIISYDFACDMQELGISYYYLEEAFKTQSPKVVMIDINSDGIELPLTSTAAHYALDFLKLDSVKLRAIFDRGSDQWEELLFPIITYHERWKNLTKDDFQYEKKRDVFKGAFVYTDSTQNETPVIPDEIPQMELSEVTITWFDKLYELCAKNNCELILMRTPCAVYNEQAFSYYDAVERYCDAKGIRFFNYTKLAGEMNIDFSEDFVDTLHMNWSGQQKLSGNIGQFLSDTYGFADKRSNSSYSQWNEDYQEMLRYIEECKEASADRELN